MHDLSPKRAAVYAATSEEPRSNRHIAYIAYGEEGHARVARQHLLWLHARGMVEKVRHGEWRRPCRGAGAHETEDRSSTR